MTHVKGWWEWEGDVAKESGTAVFHFHNDKELRVEFPSFAVAKKLADAISSSEKTARAQAADNALAYVDDWLKTVRGKRNG